MQIYGLHLACVHEFAPFDAKLILRQHHILRDACTSAQVVICVNLDKYVSIPAHKQPKSQPKPQLPANLLKEKLK
jgi:hypothetical protein